MKKLMVMLGAVAVAAGVQAGAVNWSSGDIYGVGEGGAFLGTTVANDAATGYLMVIDSDQYDSYYGIYEENGYAAMSKAIYNDYKDGKLTVKTSGKSAEGSMILGAGSYTSNTKAYAALVYETSANDADWYIANLAQITAKTSAKTGFDYANTVLGDGPDAPDPSVSIGAWTKVGGDIPEPTSAMLLLLGMAGLALRRRHA